MADFDQTQADLSAFLDEQFTTQQVKKEEDQSSDTFDEEVNSFLQGDEFEETVETQQSYTSNTQTPAVQPVNADDRILQLERELAATQARSQMYENALAERYQQQHVQQEQYVPNVAYGEQEIEIDERYEKDYGDANPYIASITKKVLNDFYQRAVIPLQQELNNVRGQLQSQGEFNQTQRSDVIHMQLKSVVPDIDELVRTQEWQSYIRQPDFYGSGRTIAHYVQEGIKYGNVRQLAQIVQQFKQGQSKRSPQAQHVAPGKAQTALPDTSKRGRGTVLRMSEFDRATQLFQTGKMSWDKYQAIADAFNEATLEGRVNYSK